MHKEYNRLIYLIAPPPPTYLLRHMPTYPATYPPTYPPTYGPT